WDTTKAGTDMNKIFKAGKDFLKSFSNEDEIKENFNEKHSKNQEEKEENNNEDLRRSIEKRKQEFLDKLKQEKEEKSVSYNRSDRGIER
ncbi:MAG: hypothetical protein IKO06_02445, partial [Alphaproteobacteria bacterium]|nr:hypothetical protein [Alphaproteobacteria bacterium]